jgi:hypothetical protein
LRADFSEAPYPSNNLKENNWKGFSVVRLVAMQTLPQTALATGFTGNSPRKCREESEARHCRCEVWRRFVETRLNLECHIPPRKTQIHHSAD